MTFDLST